MWLAMCGLAQHIRIVRCCQITGKVLAKTTVFELIGLGFAREDALAVVSSLEQRVVWRRPPPRSTARLNPKT
jgi:hypothetical protein